ncbi:MAG: AtpZ/AtpI family protein [Prolixibacteraceae bacterium]|jgi:F0F1-type ATP synthase assembly protein I|nr:AtpZ/AtpI family protein [Prolixibacteraceae bacterium]
MKTNQPKKPDPGIHNFLRYSSLGFEMLGIIGILIFLGIKIDEWLELEPVFTIILAIFSVFAALFYALRKIK